MSRKTLDETLFNKSKERIILILELHNWKVF